MNKINSDQEKQICHHPRDYTVEFCLYIFSTGCGERFMVPVAPKCHLPLHLGSPQGHTAFLRSSVILLSSHRDERMHSSLHSTDLPTSSELGTVPPLFPRASLDAFEKKKKSAAAFKEGVWPPLEHQVRLITSSAPPGILQPQEPPAGAFHVLKLEGVTGGQRRKSKNGKWHFWMKGGAVLNWTVSQL